MTCYFARGLLSHTSRHTTLIIYCLEQTWANSHQLDITAHWVKYSCGNNFINKTATLQSTGRLVSPLKHWKRSQISLNGKICFFNLNGVKDTSWARAPDYAHFKEVYNLVINYAAILLYVKYRNGRVAFHLIFNEFH